MRWDDLPHDSRWRFEDTAPGDLLFWVVPAMADDIADVFDSEHIRRTGFYLVVKITSMFVYMLDQHGGLVRVRNDFPHLRVICSREMDDALLGR
jgi:hypothetical protein